MDGSARFSVAVFVNDRAGLGTPREGLGRDIGEMFKRATCVSHVYHPQTLGELAENMRDAFHHQVDAIALNGGDGSLHAVVTAFLRAFKGCPSERLPWVIYIPTGTVQVVAASLGMKRWSPEEFMLGIRDGLEARRQLGEARCHVLRINNEFGFIYGAGLAVNFLNAYNKEGEERGPAGAIRVVLEETMSLGSVLGGGPRLAEPVHGSIMLPNNRPVLCPHNVHTAVLASTVQQLGYGIRGMPLAGTESGTFMFRSTQMTFMELMTCAPLVWSGSTILPRTFDAVTDRVNITWPEPVETAIDGEVKSPHTYDEISIGPELRFLTP